MWFFLRNRSLWQGSSLSSFCNPLWKLVVRFSTRLRFSTLWFWENRFMLSNSCVDLYNFISWLIKQFSFRQLFPPTQIGRWALEKHLLLVFSETWSWWVSLASSRIPLQSSLLFTAFTLFCSWHFWCLESLNTWKRNFKKENQTCMQNCSNHNCTDPGRKTNSHTIISNTQIKIEKVISIFP